ncbi:DgyrCDS9376 [Dimorphilus gyrociliatus]|uniref:[histone H3]-lysine(4) N-trimethyltransferase n=1 Tax=Dimorphilus gyrociliatus TaxID=2664684 RepID=A0A7I8VWT7_9ANNE|nr:DgyrCDS9376 [Dimorphilus gyrociliatus]
MANADYRVNALCPIDPRMDPRRYNEAYRGREGANVQRPKKEDFISFKLIKDPFIHKCEAKVYRYDGKPIENQPHVEVKDPRKRLDYLDRKLAFAQLDVLLPVPMLKEDDCYVGPLLRREVTIVNLNNNIDLKFLNNMARDYKILNSKIYFHPNTGKHLGIAKIAFSLLCEAQDFVEKFDGKPQMGLKIHVFFDPKGKTRQNLIVEKINEVHQPATAAPVKEAKTSPLNTSRDHSLERKTSQTKDVQQQSTRDPRSSRSSTDTLQEDNFSYRDSYRYYERDRRDTRRYNYDNRRREKYNRGDNYYRDDSASHKRNYHRNDSIKEQIEQPPPPAENAVEPDKDIEMDQAEPYTGYNGQEGIEDGELEDDERTASLDTRINMLLGVDHEEPENGEACHLNIDQPAVEEEVLTTFEESQTNDQQLELPESCDKTNDNDDRMSLSSISNGDEKIELNDACLDGENRSVSLWEHERQKQIMKNALEGTTNHLRDVLYTDVFRKSIQVFGFDVFEEWFEKSKKAAKKPDIENDQKTVESTNKTESDTEKHDTEKPITTPQILTSENLFENIGSGGFLGLRAGMPKMRSFKVPKKPRAPSPTVTQPNSRKSPSENSEDDDVSDEDFVTNNQKKPPKRREKIRYSSSSLSEESESSSSISSDEGPNGTPIASDFDAKSTGSEVDLDAEIDINKIRKGSVDAKEEEGWQSPVFSSSRQEKLSSNRGRGRGRKTNRRDSSRIDEPIPEFNLKKEPQTPEFDIPDNKSFSERDAVLTLLQISKSGGGTIKQDDNFNSTAQSVTAEHNYFNSTPPQKKHTGILPTFTDIVEKEPVDKKLEEINDFLAAVLHDHCYVLQSTPAKSPGKTQLQSPPPTSKSKKILSSISAQVPAKKQKRMPKSKPKAVRSINFSRRNESEEQKVLSNIYADGMDSEDIKLLKIAYDQMVVSGDHKEVLEGTHWAETPATIDPQFNKSRKRGAKIGLSARTQPVSIFKEARKKKQADITQQLSFRGLRSVSDNRLNTIERDSRANPVQSREARLENRRHLNAIGEYDFDSDLFKFNQLKTRRKRLRFDKSSIHCWGLFADEPIQAEEMIIEYIGEAIRSSIADFREKKYAREGIGSSYLFRLDSEMVVDATKKGNFARFINHSCNPNCYAKVVTVESSKKIVIYSKRNIDIGEEITYDYKFPYDDDKIKCHCGSAQCRGFLN